jgi:hypothetical protein
VVDLAITSRCLLINRMLWNTTSKTISQVTHPASGTRRELLGASPTCPQTGGYFLFFLIKAELIFFMGFVSANYVVAVNGGYFLVFGTSASSPVVGALLTMINDARLTIGKNPLGFINPTVRPVSPSHPSAGIKIRSICLNADLRQQLPGRF